MGDAVERQKETRILRRRNQQRNLIISKQMIRNEMFRKLLKWMCPVCSVGYANFGSDVLLHSTQRMWQQRPFLVFILVLATWSLLLDFFCMLIHRSTWNNGPQQQQPTKLTNDHRHDNSIGPTTPIWTTEFSLVQI